LKIRIASVAFLTILCLALNAPAFAGTLYNDGSTDGFTNALIIDGPSGSPGQTISDGFVATNSGLAVSFDFAEWVTGGSTPTALTWTLGSSAFGNDLGSGSGIDSFTFFASNSFGFDVYIDHVTGLSAALTAGDTYWLTLGGSRDSSGSTFDGWDLNNGPATCEFAVGGVPQGGCGFGGESFTINGGTTTPEPSSILLFGSGILGLAGILRRKLTR
jgi:PEP-CTERM motif